MTEHRSIRPATSKTKQGLAFTLFVLSALAIVGPSLADQSKTVSVLSQNQVRALKLIEEFTVVRIDWNRSTLGKPLAYSLQGEPLASFKKHLPDISYKPEKKPQTGRLNAQGTLICRLILRTLSDVWALFMRCELGNQLTVIIRREDLVMLDHQPTREEARLLMDDQIARLGRTLSLARQRQDSFQE